MGVESFFVTLQRIGSRTNVMKREPGENPGQSRCCVQSFMGRTIVSLTFFGKTVRCLTASQKTCHCYRKRLLRGFGETEIE